MSPFFGFVGRVPFCHPFNVHLVFEAPTPTRSLVSNGDKHAVFFQLAKRALGLPIREPGLVGKFTDTRKDSFALVVRPIGEGE